MDLEPLRSAVPVPCFALPTLEDLSDDPTRKKWEEYCDSLKDLLQESNPIRYLQLTESNDHEGESWNFYCKYLTTEISNEELYELEEIIEKNNCDWKASSPFNPDTVKTLVENSGSAGYMDCENYGPDLTREGVDALLKCKKCQECIQQWYKGDIDLSKCPHKTVRRPKKESVPDNSHIPSRGRAPKAPKKKSEHPTIWLK